MSCTGWSLNREREKSREIWALTPVLSSRPIFAVTCKRHYWLLLAAQNGGHSAVLPVPSPAEKDTRWRHGR